MAANVIKASGIARAVAYTAEMVDASVGVAVSGQNEIWLY
jgi:hypothetical protein